MKSVHKHKAMARANNADRLREVRGRVTDGVWPSETQGGFLLVEPIEADLERWQQQCRDRREQADRRSPRAFNVTRPVASKAVVERVLWQHDPSLTDPRDASIRLL